MAAIGRPVRISSRLFTKGDEVMIVRHAVRLGGFLAAALMLPSISTADDAWNFTPDNGAQNVEQPIDINTVVAIGSAGALDVMTEHVGVYVNGEPYSGTTKNITTQFKHDDNGTLVHSWIGTISFDPAVPSGAEVMLVYTVITTDMVKHEKSVTFTVD